MEIITRPSVLFLDEPTSSLDSATAYQVMKHVKEIARRYLPIRKKKIELIFANNQNQFPVTHREKQVVLASIHQPASHVFALFDKVSIIYVIYMESFCNKYIYIYVR